MKLSKYEIQDLIERLQQGENFPDDCILEDVQYHLYVIEKIQRGKFRAETERTLSQQEVERKFNLLSYLF